MSKIESFQEMIDAEYAPEEQARLAEDFNNDIHAVDMAHLDMTIFEDRANAFAQAHAGRYVPHLVLVMLDADLPARYVGLLSKQGAMTHMSSLQKESTL